RSTRGPILCDSSAMISNSRLTHGLFSLSAAIVSNIRPNSARNSAAFVACLDFSNTSSHSPSTLDTTAMKNSSLSAKCQYSAPLVTPAARAIRASDVPRYPYDANRSIAASINTWSSEPRRRTGCGAGAAFLRDGEIILNDRYGEALRVQRSRARRNCEVKQARLKLKRATILRRILFRFRVRAVGRR